MSVMTAVVLSHDQPAGVAALERRPGCGRRRASGRVLPCLQLGLTL